MRTTRFLFSLAGILILAACIVSWLLLPNLPEQMASHWNMQGEVDGTIPKLWGAFLMPAISAVMLLLFAVLPLLDPLRKNFEKFRHYYDGFVLLMVVFLLYLHLLILLWNLGMHYEMERALLPALAALFLYTSLLLKHAERNWFVGIRTPWTLSSDRVWRKTHQLGSVLFALAALGILAAGFAQQMSMTIVLGSILGAALIPIVYSFMEFRKEERGMKNKSRS